MEASALEYTGGVALGRSPLLRLQSDERLIMLVRRGNSAAFETLVARYNPRLLAFCRHMLGSHEDAEDVLQEAFAAAYNAILADNRPINARPWLYRIARNRSLNHLRRAQAVGMDSMDIHFSDFGATTADKVHSREDFRALVSDIGGLPETQRTALVLRELDALSYEQIAEAMETTVPSVKSLLVRARVSLAEAAEARQLTCDEVRMELGQIAEGLLRKPTPPVRRHLKTCKRCDDFQGQLKKTNRALAALLPIAPLAAVLRHTALAHIGHSAGSGATAAGSSVGAAGAGTAGTSVAGTGAAAGVGSGAAAGVGTAAGSTAIGSTAAAGSAVAAGGSASGLVSAGVGALASKAAAGLAAAALMTASAVAVSHTARPRRAEPTAAAAGQTVLAPLTSGVAAGASAGSSLAAPTDHKSTPTKAATLDKPKAATATAVKHTKTSTGTKPQAASASTAGTTATQGRTDTTTINTVLPPGTTQATVNPSTASVEAMVNPPVATTDASVEAMVNPPAATTVTTPAITTTSTPSATGTSGPEAMSAAPAATAPVADNTTSAGSASGAGGPSSGTTTTPGAGSTASQSPPPSGIAAGGVSDAAASQGSANPSAGIPLSIPSSPADQQSAGIPLSTPNPPADQQSAGIPLSIPSRTDPSYSASSGS
jgi:RNA polymerase sigma factor (sigma-70 family)